MNPPPPTPIWTGPVILTLCISSAAFLLSIIALAWQVISWRRSGARLKVTTTWGVFDTPAGTGRWFLGITVRNRGRLATEIDQIGFQLPRWRQHRQLVVPTMDAMGSPIQRPIPLGPGASTSLTFDVPSTLAGLRQAGLSGKGARPFADTGHGRTRGGRRNIGKMLEELNRPDVTPRSAARLRRPG